MRVAQVCGRLDDPDRFLDSMTTEAMDMAQAYDNAHGVGLARITEIITTGFAYLILSWSDDKKLDLAAMRKRLDPWLSRE